MVSVSGGRMRLRGLWLLVFGALAAVGPVRAQRGIFVTPIANAPFMAVVTEQQTSLDADGTWSHQRSLHAIARNAAGAIYNEARPLVPESFAGDPPIRASHIYDPQTRISTMIYPQQRTYLQNRLLRPPATEPPDSVAVASPGTPDPLTQQTDLGNKTMEGVTVHGVRITQKIPGQNGQDVTVTDEYWYSPDLRLNMLVKHDDPRSLSVTLTVTQMSRTQPDPAIFAVPDGYRNMRADGGQP
jgi:hypothetical protein